MNNLKNHIVIVTGGEGLLGKAIVNELKAAGANVISIDINIETNLDEGKYCCDITNETAIVNAFNNISTHFGYISGIVNNAYPRTKDWGNTFENIAFESWKANVDFQLNSTFLCVQKILPHLRKSKVPASIINMGSIYGAVGADFSLYNGTSITNPAAYSAIKGGVINFTRYMASYLGSENIRVNCVSPGGIIDQQSATFIQNYEAKVPMKRMGTPQDIAGPIAFLLSEKAGYITGQNLLVDGGWTAI